MGTEAISSESGRIRVLVEGALCVALSVVFSYLKIFRMPQGGSVTLEMAPLLYFAYRRGVGWGVCAGAMSGVLQMLLGGYVVHPAQALLDYPLAFACLGAGGMRWHRPIPGTLVAVAARLFSHVCSGVIFFASYAPEGQNPWLYSTVYNAGFMVPSAIMSALVAWMLWKRMAERGDLR